MFLSNEQVDRLNNLIDSYVDKIKKLKIDIDFFKNIVEKQVDEIRALKNKNASLEKELREVKKINARLEAKNLANDLVLRETLSSLKDLEMPKSKLETKVKKVLVRDERAEKELEKLKKELEEVKKENSILKNREESNSRKIKDFLKKGGIDKYV